MAESSIEQFRNILFILLLAISLVPISLTQIQFASATSKSPYESGYDHGCDDADISDPDDRYINQPEKGPSFHTNEFMRGYNAGYDECSDDGEGSSSDNGDSSSGDTFADGQRAGKAQGHSDAINGRPSDANCGSGHSNSYCAGYKLGYNVEYQVTRLVQD